MTVVVFEGTIHRNIQSTKEVDIHNNIQTVIFTNNNCKKESKQPLHSNSEETTPF